jgi:NAD-dependent dihydropyrimidine dehydrogenase PreA subunit
MKIDTEKCISCGMCYDGCERHGLTLESTHDMVLYIQNENCNQCGECARNCPADAISESI